VAELRRLTERHGALLIFDEVMTGFRLAFGGAQHLLGVRPDLTVLGKIVGGGFPVGAYGGRADLRRRGGARRAGGPGGGGAGRTQEWRDNPPYERLEALGQVLAEGVGAAAAELGVPHRLNRVGSMWTLFFTGEPVVDLDTAKRSDTARFAKFFWAMMD